MAREMTRAQQHQLAVLGAAILDPERCKEVIGRLSPQAFEEGNLRKLFRAVKQLLDSGRAVDAVSVENLVGSDFRRLITYAAETVPTISHVEDYEAFVLEDYRRRLLAEACMAAASEDSSDVLCAKLRAALEMQDAIRAAVLDESAREFDTVVDDTLKRLSVPDTLLRLGWRAVDYYGLFERTNTVVIAGRPGNGKTDFALSLATRFSRHCRVYYLTMEETREKLMTRIFSRVSRIDSTRIRDRDLDADELQSLTNTARLLKNHHNMVLDDGQNLTVEAIRAKLLRHKPDIVFLDHIGLIAGSDPKQREYERLSEATRQLKQMAMSLNIVLVELVQLNRLVDKLGGARAAKLGDLRGSGTIEQDANCVMFVENEVTGETELRGADAYLDVPIRVSKNRDGITGRFEMRWQPQYHSWEPAPDAAHDFTEYTGPLPESFQQQFSSRNKRGNNENNCCD